MSVSVCRTRSCREVGLTFIKLLIQSSSNLSLLRSAKGSPGMGPESLDSGYLDFFFFFPFFTCQPSGFGDDRCWQWWENGAQRDLRWWARVGGLLRP